VVEQREGALRRQLVQQHRPLQAGRDRDQQVGQALVGEEPHEVGRVQEVTATARLIERQELEQD
jgi:hypothetical protein